ncbi:MAG: DEAD/DEAH box helicase [Mycoplasmataceae bacterium]|jgi:ATP-dependent RNA helicase DeaD|nr:DEAD/DEAH box helicase [Mycoplasmataceae bacterium]
MKFSDLQINKAILTAINDAKYENMTDVQEHVIPLFLAGKDLLIKAPTGTGKTAAFVVPSLEKLDPESSNIQVLVLAPTRELVNQIAVEYKKLAANLPHAKILAIYGGQNISTQLKLLKDKQQIIVSTPGRLLDHLERRTINLSHIKTVILDEADEMLNMGFIRDIEKILRQITHQHQTVLYSATFNKGVYEISNKFQTNREVFETKEDQTLQPKIEQFFVKINEKNKLDFVIKLLKNHQYQYAVIFSNMKHKARRLAESLTHNGLPSSSIQSNLSQNARDHVMKEFRAGKFRILVATDVAARGIDVKGVELVINYDMPRDIAYYVHRIGRTARNQTSGIAYTLLNSSVNFNIRKIEEITKQKIKEHLVQEYEFEEEKEERFGHGRQQRSGGGNRHFGHGRNFRSNDHRPRFENRDHHENDQEKTHSEHHDHQEGGQEKKSFGGGFHRSNNYHSEHRPYFKRRDYHGEQKHDGDNKSEGGTGGGEHHFKRRSFNNRPSFNRNSRFSKRRSGGSNYSGFSKPKN